VLISSHILTEISQTCDRLLVLKEGEIIAAGAEKDLATRMVRIHRIIAVVRAGEAGDEAGEAVARCIEAVDGVVKIESKDSERDSARAYEIHCTSDLRSAIGRAVIQAGHDLIRLDDQGDGDLEHTFLELVKGGSPDAND
jgi:ABC-2 type transport system ATP-binding protein